MTKSEQAEDALARLNETRERLLVEIRKGIIGQDEVIEQLLVTLLAQGHCLLTGIPGLGKTLLVKTLAKCLSLSFKRIQFTPDLMPSDITGTDIIQHDEDGRREFRFIKGPVFCNILLADEINRAPPKVQAALLEAMEERQVTIAGETYHLENPFMVLATQNPVELHGTYPLAEAQLDRFAMKLQIGYPDRVDEKEIVRRVAKGTDTTSTVESTGNTIYTMKYR